LRKEVEFLVPGTWTAASDRRVFAPKGLSGGEAASPQRYEVRIAAGEEWQPVGERINLRVPAGARVRITTPGGGGIGSPFERPVASVLADLRDGRITAARAERTYGVVASRVANTWMVDADATAALRIVPQ
jgi:N-methylhydantoinase B